MEMRLWLEIDQQVLLLFSVIKDTEDSVNQI